MLLEKRMPFVTYPMRPFNCRGASQNKAFGGWSFEGKANGWRCLVDLENGLVWSRHGKPFSMASQVMSVVRGDGYNFGAVRWLDCELLGRRTKTGAGSVLLLDVVGDGTYTERRGWLDVLLECPWDDIPKGRFLRLPSFNQTEALNNIETMKAVNALRKEVVWEGVVCKHPLSKYETQTRSPDAECRFWAKDRFI